MDWRDLGFMVIGFLLGIAAALWVLVYIANARAPPCPFKVG